MTGELSNKFKQLWYLVGNTPMLEIRYKYQGKPGRIFAKCEHYNLTGSIKEFNSASKERRTGSWVSISLKARSIKLFIKAANRSPPSTVLLIFNGTMDFNQRNSIELDALKETLEIRLLERLREDESGVYSPGVFANTSKYPQGGYSFIVKFSCAPQNVN